MPTFRQLFPDEVLIDPPIFSFHVQLPVMDMSAGEIIAAQCRWNDDLAGFVSSTGGRLYLVHRWVVFFGYLSAPLSAALQLAGEVRQRMSALYFDSVSLSVSTVGLSRHSHIHSRPVDYLSDPKFPEVLLARIKFKGYDDYLNADGRSP